MKNHFSTSVNSYGAVELGSLGRMARATLHFVLCHLRHQQKEIIRSRKYRFLFRLLIPLSEMRT